MSHSRINNSRPSSPVVSRLVDPPFGCSRLWDVGWVLECRFHLIRDLPDLDRLITSVQEVLDTMEENHPEWYLSTIYSGRLLFHRFHRTGNPLDLGSSAQLLQRAVGTYHQDQEDRYLAALGHHALANTLGAKYGQSGVLDDLHLGLDAALHALEAVDGDDHISGVFAQNVAVFLFQRFRVTGCVDDLEDAICQVFQACQITGRTRTSHASLLLRLYDALDSIVAAEPFSTRTDVADFV